jgi:uncharacterized alpha-E superfamily protein
LLILREDMPRSLHACADGIVRMLQLIANKSSAETDAPGRRAACHAAFRAHRRCLAGLHEYLTDFMDRIFELGDGISATSWFRAEAPVRWRRPAQATAAGRRQ